MYDAFYWLDVTLDSEYLQELTEIQDTEKFIEQQMINEYEERKAVTIWQ